MIETPALRPREIADHLASCPSCARAASALSLLDEEMSADVTKTFVSGVRSALATTHRRPRFGLAWRLAAIVLAVAAAALVVRLDRPGERGGRPASPPPRLSRVEPGELTTRPPRAPEAASRAVRAGPPAAASSSPEAPSGPAIIVRAGQAEAILRWQRRAPGFHGPRRGEPLRAELSMAPLEAPPLHFAEIEVRSLLASE